jgi:hypothetical protein
VWRIKKEICEKARKSLASIDPPENDADWIEVGQALKAIDRNLYNDWYKWSSDFMSGYKCQVLWDFFSPRCCDIHSAAYSGMRDTFLKLLRPGLDHEKVFDTQWNRKWAKLERQADESEDLDHDEVSGARAKEC